jgi:hypothetical protein
METEGSSTCSQESSTVPYPQPDRFTLHQSIPSLLSSILVISTHLRLGLFSDLFLSGFFINILYMHSSSAPFVLRPVRLIHFHLIILIIFEGENKSWSSSLCSFLPVRIWWLQNYWLMWYFRSLLQWLRTSSVFWNVTQWSLVERYQNFSN